MLALISFSLPALAIGLVLSYFIGQTIYNLFLHPLRSYPGPLLSKATQLPYTYHSWNGHLVRHITALHDKYGEVVRVSTNVLSYNTAQAWQDIYSHRSPSGAGNLPKEDRYRQLPPNATPNIIAANDEDHKRMRRLQSHAFSDKALKDQEPLITDYVDKLISRLQEKASNEDTATFDLVQWYNYTTFDILGDLAFGESFGCLESSTLHPFVKTIFKSIKDFSFYRLARPFPSPIFELLRKLAPQGLSEGRAEEFAFASSKARARISRGATDRVDFTGYMLKHNDERGMTEKEIESNASLLIIAGSETTATFLSGITYHLLRTPQVLQKLTGLVRTTFPSEAEININSIQELEYFTACLEEGFRTYPPVPAGLERKTVGQGSTINGRFVPPGVTVMVVQWACYSSPSNFADPNDFVPDRWMKPPPAEYANDNRKVLNPFSLGPRNCIGRNLAYAEIRLILARMLWNFDMELQPSSFNWSDQLIFTLWEKVPLDVKLTTRKA